MSRRFPCQSYVLGLGCLILACSYFSTPLSNKLPILLFIRYYNDYLRYYSKILSFCISRECCWQSYVVLLWIHFSFDVSVDQMFYFAFFLLFLNANFVLNCVLCSYNYTRSLAEIQVSDLGAPLLCKSMCEEDAVKSNRGDVRRNSSLACFWFEFFFFFGNQGCGSSPSHERGQCALPPTWLMVNLPLP